EEEKPQKQVVQKAQKIHVKGTTKKEEPPQRKSPKKEESEESPWFEPEGELAVDVYQTNGEIVIQSTIAGVSSDDLDVNIENDVVTISGERRNPNEEEDKSYFYQECYWGPFSRQIILPEEIDTSRIEASMKDGVFTLRLPKLERQKVKRIKVRG
ncbi:MAG: Hsp20/alpha crystallin family protein, partial [Candidatus Wildermuthbacteria bacterium]|nr:Hsp20/alpha crystallin family protein [Candidatus Wildermuthbacteria bacterium]